MEFKVDLPQWAVEKQNSLPEYMTSTEDKMRAVIDFSRENIRHNTGGPFAAGVFEKKTGKRVIIGVNRVMPTNCSSAHAEVVAISLAQQILGTFDIGGSKMPEYELVVNWRPCIMCIGAVIWSGLRHLTIAGSGSELEDITGFDEGPVSSDWVEQMTLRGITVQDNILGVEAIEVFKEFAASGSHVYNGRAAE
ncbi:MAG: nucleoside deaminase [Desulfotalea sp.]